jgi:hypothetical protein
MSIKLQVANFTGDKNEVVAWVAAIEGKLPGMKKSRVKVNGEDKWVPACSPETILSILDSDHDHLRAVCGAAMAAAPKKAKQTETPVQYFFLKSGALQLDSVNAPRLLSAEEVAANAADDCLFCKVGSAHWATAKDLGLLAPPAAVVPPPPPMPTTQSVPMSPPAQVTQMSTAAAAMQRIEEAKARTLAAKRAS